MFMPGIGKYGEQAGATILPRNYKVVVSTFVKGDNVQSCFTG